MTGLPIDKKFRNNFDYRNNLALHKKKIINQEIKHTASVVIPSGRSLSNVNFVINSLLRDNNEALLEIIVVLDRITTSEDIKFISTLNEKVQIEKMNKNSGAGLARNKGIQKAKGDIILFIDDDCIPSKTWINNHLKHYNDNNIVGVGGPILFYNTSHSKKKHALYECSMLYSFQSALHYKELFWNPTANFSVRSELAKKCLFNGAFPKSGGGEDVFFGFQLAKFGKIISEPAAWVKHPYWSGRRNIVKRFFRWGYADCVLAMEFEKEEGLSNKIIARELTPVSWFILSLIISGAIGMISGVWEYILIPFGGFFSWVFFEVLLWHRDKGIRHALVEIISVLFFDLGSTLTRILPKYLKVMQKRILFFPDQLIWLWIATRRVRIATIIGYIFVIFLIIIIKNEL
jgi:GT2 family glycosyltransferase